MVKQKDKPSLVIKAHLVELGQFYELATPPFGAYLFCRARLDDTDLYPAHVHAMQIYRKNLRTVQSRLNDLSDLSDLAPKEPVTEKKSSVIIKKGGKEIHKQGLKQISPKY